MSPSALIREALRIIACAVLAHTLMLQVVLSAVAGSAHAAAQITGVDRLGVICAEGAASDAGSDERRTPDHARAGTRCCAWACPVVDPLAPLRFVAAAPGWDKNARCEVVAAVGASNLVERHEGSPLQPRAPPHR